MGLGAHLDRGGLKLVLVPAHRFCHEIGHLDGHMYTELTDRLYTAEELDELLAQEDDQDGDPSVRDRPGLKSS